MHETELASAVVAWLTDHDWECFSEVEARPGRADIVATDDRPLVWVVECKLSMGLGVLAQACRWKPYAHMISVAVPQVQRSYDQRDFLTSILDWKGLGLFEYWGGGVSETMTAPLFRKPPAVHRLKGLLCEEHKTHAEPGSRGTWWTVKKATKKKLAEAVAKHPGLTWKELLEGPMFQRHHYAHASSAKQHLTNAVLAGTVPGVKLEKDGRQWRLWPC